MDRLRAAVIGLGVGEQHVLAYATHRGCVVAALCDLSLEKREMAEAKYPGVRVTRDPAEVLEDPDIDVISIASYDDVHAEQVVAALDAGKHVFVEKPLCRTQEELQAIHRAWLQHGGRVKLSSNLVLRAAPLYMWLKSRITMGDMGDPYAFDGDYLYGRLRKLTEGWRKQVEGYSVMEAGGIHLVDLFIWLTGQRPERVSAMGNRVCTLGTDFRYEDYVAATMQCPSGVVARVTANFGCVHRHQHALRLFGTQATFLYDDAGARWHWSRDPEREQVPVEMSPVPSSKGVLVGPFVDAIREERDLDGETCSHFDVMSICLAADASLRSGQSQAVRYL